MLCGGTLFAADEPDQDNLRPPQTLPKGFESTDKLLRDLEKAENAPLYSAWLVESSRFVNVAPGSFMPDRAFIPGSTDPKHDIPFFDFPANVGIIKGKDGQITLYDSGWKQLAYIFDWNTSCCWWDLPNQMKSIGLDPAAVTRIVIGHGHWDHAGQLDSFPNAVLYVQKEELNQIDFFLDYPTEFNGGHIRAVNTVDPITGAQVGPPGAGLRAEPGLRVPAADGRGNRGQDHERQGEHRRRTIRGRPGSRYPPRVPGPYLRVAAPASPHAAG
jgi:hypothetical protein